MAPRPYFKHGIEQLQELVATFRSDLKALKVIQYELGFRERPKARALKTEVDDLLGCLAAGGTVPDVPPSPPQPPQSPPPDVQSTEPQVQSVPDRVVVECANCKTPNFVSTLEGVVQHLSCSTCKSPYEAQFKYGVMRTTFQAPLATKADHSSTRWIVIGVVLLIALVLLFK